jgi:hypothetical protein
MGQFKKKPVTIEAMQWIGDWKNISSFVKCAQNQNDELLIPTLEGVMTAKIGDWIIKGVKGEFYPCKPDIFEATYEAVTTMGDGTEAPSVSLSALVRQLPSDEEIEKEARVRGLATIVDLDDDNSGTVELEEGFIQGAKWMRNQARQSA